MTPLSGENRLTKQQKTGFVLLLVFGILTISLGFLQMKNGLYSPFANRLVSEGGTRTIGSFYDDQTRLQQIDTDQDGFNDYEELEFYGTSPYLPDTDSDGLDDQTEIEQGTNPLCPEGEDCGADASSLPPTEAEIESLLGSGVSTPWDLVLGSSAGLPMASSTDIDALLKDPEALRQLILNTGSIKPEQLDAIGDDELLKLVQEILSAQKPLEN